jgi:AraC-like DNA-binding protein
MAPSTLESRLWMLNVEDALTHTRSSTIGRVDILAEELAQARARGAVFSVLRRIEPWGLSFGGTRPLTAHVMLHGDAWLEQDGEEPRPVHAGDSILVRAGAPYRITSRPGTATEPIDDARARGNDEGEGEASVLLCGAYVLEGSVALSLLRSLPRVVILPATERDPSHAAAVALLEAEVRREAPGRQTLLDRLLDLNLVYALRSWWSHADAHAPGWYRALSDPALGRVLDRIHTEPQRAWTVDGMARLAGLSRAGFSARFSETVGTPPRRYLTGLRMRRAQDLLERTDATLARIADDVGYSNEFAFATAFRKHTGTSPGAWRAQHHLTPREP